MADPVMHTADKLRAVRDRFTMAQPDKPESAYAVLTQAAGQLDEGLAALERIDADKVRAAKAADRFERRGNVEEAYRALGIAEGLRTAASIIRAAISSATGEAP